MLTRPSPEQEYFQQAVGQVKKVDLSYGPGGVSRGIASVIFSHSDGASKAFKELNGLLIDNRPVKVSIWSSWIATKRVSYTMNRSRLLSLLPT